MQWQFHTSMYVTQARFHPSRYVIQATVAVNCRELKCHRASERVGANETKQEKEKFSSCFISPFLTAEINFPRI